MLPPSFLTVAPLLLAIPAAAVPVLGARDTHTLEVECVDRTVTVTETVFPTDYNPISEQYSPLSTEVAAPATPPSLVITPLYATTTAGPTPPGKSPSPIAQAPAASPSVASNATETTADNTPDPNLKYRNTLYFTNWGIYGANFQPQQLPASQLTHVLYAFADIGPDGEVKSSDSYADLQKHYPTDSWNDVGNNAYGCVKQLYLLKKKNRNMKVLLSIGGWTYSPKFSPAVGNDAGRAKFASSAIKLVQDWGLDGIDIDWEYPSNAADAQSFVLLLQACRQAFDDYAAQYAQGYHFLITIAAPAGPDNIQNMPLESMDPWVDAWHIMTYDYAGSWDSTTGHQANIYASTTNPVATKFSTEAAIRDYLVRGIAPAKLSMGLPLYGHGFDATDGLGLAYNGIGAGSVQSGIWLYRDLPRAGAQELYDDAARASYSYDAGSRELVTYDTIGSAVAKAQYLMGRRLGGAFFWEASGDKTGGQSLVATMAGQLGQLEQSANLLNYPASQYDNIRAGVPGS